MTNGKSPNGNNLVVVLGPNYVRFHGPFVAFTPPQPKEISEVSLHMRSPQSSAVTSRHVDDLRRLY